MLSNLIEFYHQYQSSYADFGSAIAFLKLLDPASDSSENESDHLSEEEKGQDFDNTNRKKWSNTRSNIDVNYAKALLLKLSQDDLSAITIGLKDTVILVACKAASATLRAKSLKIVNHLIKSDPEKLLDDKIK